MTLWSVAKQRWHKLTGAFREEGLSGVSRVLGEINPRKQWRYWWNQVQWEKFRRAHSESEVVVEVPHGRLWVNLEYSGISRELALHGVHEPHLTEIMSGSIEAGDTAIDAGANIGYYALLEAQAAGPTGRVVAIEPHPDNLRLLRKNIDLNGVDNISVFQGAIGKEEGSAMLSVSPSSNFHSLLPREDTKETIEVPVYPLDDLVEEEDLDRVDLVRMDIEGYEVEALGGMTRILKEFRPTLVIEFHPTRVSTESAVAFLEKLKESEYELRQISNRLLDHAWLEHWHWRILEKGEIGGPKGPRPDTLDGLMKDPYVLSGTDRVCDHLILEPVERA